MQTSSGKVRGVEEEGRAISAVRRDRAGAEAARRGDKAVVIGRRRKRRRRRSQGPVDSRRAGRLVGPWYKMMPGRGRGKGLSQEG